MLGLVVISPPFLKKLLLKWLSRASIERGASIGWFSGISARTIKLGRDSTIRPFTLIRLDGNLTLGEQSEISSMSLIYGSSSLRIGSRSYIGPQSIVNVEEEVTLGDGTALGPRSMVFTHGSFLPYTEGYWANLAGVRLGDRVWCAAQVFLHPGVEIGNDSFVNAGSVVTRSIPAGSVVEGNPARVVRSMDQIRRKMTPARLSLVMEKVLESFTDIGLKRGLGVATVEGQPRDQRFEYRGKRYRICLVSSKEELDQATDGASHERIIVVTTDEQEPLPKDALHFDLAAGQATETSDSIHRSLRTFLRRYYGIRFADKAPQTIQ